MRTSPISSLSTATSDDDGAQLALGVTTDTKTGRIWRSAGTERKTVPNWEFGLRGRRQRHRLPPLIRLGGGWMILMKWEARDHGERHDLEFPCT